MRTQLSTTIGKTLPAAIFIVALLASPLLAQESAKPEGSGGMMKGGMMNPHGDGGDGPHGGGYGGHGKSEGGYAQSHQSMGKHGGQGGHHEESPFGHILHYRKVLGLTAEQTDKIQQLDLDFTKQRIQNHADIKIAYVEMDSVVHSGTVDEARIRQLADKMAEAKGKSVRAMAEAKITLLKLLTPEQLAKVKELHSSHH